MTTIIYIKSSSLTSSSSASTHYPQHCIICCQQLDNDNNPQQQQRQGRRSRNNINQEQNLDNKKLFKSICQEFNFINPSSSSWQNLDFNSCLFCTSCKETAMSLLNVQNLMKDCQIQLQRLMELIEGKIVQSSSQQQQQPDNNDVFCTYSIEYKDLEEQIKYFRQHISSKDLKKKKRKRMCPSVLIEKLQEEEEPKTLSSSMPVPVQNVPSRRQSKIIKTKEKPRSLKRGNKYVKSSTIADSTKSCSRRSTKKSKATFEEIVLKEEGQDEFQENHDDDDQHFDNLNTPLSALMDSSNSNHKDPDFPDNTVTGNDGEVFWEENPQLFLEQNSDEDSPGSEIELGDEDPDWNHDQQDLSEDDEEDPLELSSSASAAKKSKSSKTKSSSSTRTPAKRGRKRKEKPPKIPKKTFYCRQFFKPAPDNDPNKLIHKDEFEVTILQEGVGENGEELKGKFQCNTCQFIAGTRDTMMYHIRLVHLDEGYNCQLCPKKYSKANKLTQHVNSVHLGQRTQCPICSKPLKYPKSLERHLWSHKNQAEQDEYIATTNKTFLLKNPNPVLERDQICNICGKCYTTKTIKAHEQSHAHQGLERNFHCMTCGKSFLSLRDLQFHERKHKDANRYQCPVCCKGFYDKNLLTKHTRVHTGERIYDCPHCDKKFGTTATLKSHQVVHTMDKPFKCKGCGAAFAWRTQLERHVKRCRNVVATTAEVETKTESMTTTMSARAGLQIIEGWPWT